MKPSLIIAGLGNPGKAYERTRHNIGFQAVDVLSHAFGQDAWREKEKFAAFVQEARVVTAPVLLVKPLTFMNLSGGALRKIVDFYKIDPATQLLVMCDDIDLPLASVRYRAGGGPGTHNGLKSVALEFGEDFPRVRIGLGTPPPGTDLAAWVLSVPTAEEAGELEHAVQGMPSFITDYVMGKLNAAS